MHVDPKSKDILLQTTKRLTNVSTFNLDAIRSNLLSGPALSTDLISSFTDFPLWDRVRVGLDVAFLALSLELLVV